MKVVIPMAGRGSRYAREGWKLPKPLIEVAGKPMIFWALHSLSGLDMFDWIFVLLKEHERIFNVSKLISNQYPNANFVFLDRVTEGQLCTVLAARDYIDPGQGLLVASSDTLVTSNIANDIFDIDKQLSGLISVANLPGDHWSFTKVENGLVIQVAEKQRISDHASTGLYYFSSGKEFLRSADHLIKNKQKTKGEYYVIPVYQNLIDKGLKVGISPADGFYDMGTPSAKVSFEQKMTSIMDQLSKYE